MRQRVKQYSLMSMLINRHRYKEDAGKSLDKEIERFLNPYRISKTDNLSDGWQVLRAKKGNKL